MYPKLQLASAFERKQSELLGKYRKEITKIEKVRNSTDRLFQEIANLKHDRSAKKSYRKTIPAYYLVKRDLWMAWVATLYLNINWSVKAPEHIATNRAELEDPISATDSMPFKKTVTAGQIDDKGYSYVGLTYFSVTNAEYNNRLFQVYLSTRAPFGLVYDPAPEARYFRRHEGDSLPYLSYSNIYALCDILRLALMQERHEVVRELLFRLKTILSHGDVPHTMSEMAHLRHFTPFLHWYASWLQARFAEGEMRKELAREALYWALDTAVRAAGNEWAMDLFSYYDMCAMIGEFELMDERQQEFLRYLKRFTLSASISHYKKMKETPDHYIPFSEKNAPSYDEFREIFEKCESK